jgi:hypothetical protein
MCKAQALPINMEGVTSSVLVSTTNQNSCLAMDSTLAKSLVRKSYGKPPLKTAVLSFGCSINHAPRHLVFGWGDPSGANVRFSKRLPR